MDLTLRLLRHGYDAVDVDRRHRAGPGATSDADHVSRLLGRRALVVRSEVGARTFYDESVVVRRGAIPVPLAWLLFGRGAVHTLDGEPHRRRKLLLVETVSADGLGPAVDTAEELLRTAVATWPGRVVDVRDELVVVYGRAVLAWAGIGLPQAQATEVSRCLATIVDGFGFSGAAYLHGWRARARANGWARELVRRVRTGEVGATAGSPLALLAASDLSAAVAGVELLNVLRPTVAVAWLGAFAALHLAQSPPWRARLVEGGDAVAFAFAQEVRRTTPFAPLLAARVVRRATVGEHHVRRGDVIVLDVLGIDADPQRWPEPDRFDPTRFLDRLPGAFDLVPQGGGHPSGHRCPGESLTLRLLAMTARVLAECDYRLVDASVDRTRIPTVPAGGTRITQVHTAVAG